MTRVNILKGLTVFLIRKKMGLKKNEKFPDFYFVLGRKLQKSFYFTFVAQQPV